MRFPTLLTALTSLLLLVSPSLSDDDDHVLQSYCPARQVSVSEQRAIYIAFIQELLVAKNVTGAYLRFVSPALIEHNPFSPQGRDANAAILAQILASTSFTILRSGFDNDIGFSHVRVEGNPQPSAIADFYRFNGSCIVEHWDVTQTRPANATNPIALF